MDILRLTISCLTGFGALALITIAAIGGFICFVMWQDTQEEPEPRGPFYEGCLQSLLSELEEELK